MPSEILLEARAREQKQGFFQIDFGRIALAQLNCLRARVLPVLLSSTGGLRSAFCQTKNSIPF